MILSDDVAAGFLYLSSLSSSPDTARDEYERLVKFSRYIPEAYAPAYNWLADWYANTEVFPDFTQFAKTFEVENEISLDVNQAKRLYESSLVLWESDYILSSMRRAPLAERRQSLDRLSSLLSESVAESAPALSSRDFGVDSYVVSEVEDDGRFVFPVKRLNRMSVIRPGTTIAVVGGPGSGKTAFSLNILYANCVTRPRRGLLVYLENLPSSYQAELLARHSVSCGMKLENLSIKRGIDKDDASSYEMLSKLSSQYGGDMKGEIFYKPFTDYPTDPLRFGAALAADVVSLDLDFIVYDYLQRAKSFAPPRVDQTAYLNNIQTVLSQVALGGFGGRPCVVVTCAQPNRAGMERVERTKGSSYNLFDISESSSVERDSFMVLGLYSDAESRAANQLNVKVIKNRDGDTDMAAVPTRYVPSFCDIGDLSDDSSDDSSIYSAGVLSDLFGGDDDFDF